MMTLVIIWVFFLFIVIAGSFIGIMMDHDNEYGPFLLCGILCMITLICGYGGAVEYSRQQAVKAGAAEWRQVVQADGSVENEFHYISSKPVEKTAP